LRRTWRGAHFGFPKVLQRLGDRFGLFGTRLALLLPRSNGSRGKAMQCWFGGAVALALMLSWIGVGHAFSLDSDPTGGDAGVTIGLDEPEPEMVPDAQEMVLTPVPEPSTLLLLTMGLGGLAVLGTRARTRH